MAVIYCVVFKHMQWTRKLINLTTEAETSWPPLSDDILNAFSEWKYINFNQDLSEVLS